METERFTIVRSVPIPPQPDPEPVPSTDLDPPTLVLEVPTETEATEFGVKGSVTDDSGVAEVKVNNRAILFLRRGTST